MKLQPDTYAARASDSGRGKKGRAARKTRERVRDARAPLSRCTSVMPACSAPRLFRSRRLKLVLNQDQGGFAGIELTAALGLRRLEHARRFGRTKAHSVVVGRVKVAKVAVILAKVAVLQGSPCF